MSENSKLTLQSKLSNAQTILQQVGIKTARLDCLVLAELILNKNHAWILANPDFELDARTSQKFDKLVLKRAQNIPVAYLTGKKEFYGRDFIVTPEVLIPRPETEMLIEIIKNRSATDEALDVGTGSGAIAITLALETKLQVDACDISKSALKVAMQNAHQLNARVNFFESDLLSSVSKKYDLITANLPYVNKSWQPSAETKFEPSLALFANDHGLELIKKLLDQAPQYLKSGGLVLLEADPRQHLQISKHSQAFKTIIIQDFAILLQLVD